VRSARFTAPSERSFADVVEEHVKIPAPSFAK
jgi:hypothetical protein